MPVGFLNVHFREHCFLLLKICAKSKDAGSFFIPSFTLFPSGEDLVKFVQAHLLLLRMRIGGLGLLCLKTIVGKGSTPNELTAKVPFKLFWGHMHIYINGHQPRSYKPVFTHARAG